MLQPSQVHAKSLHSIGGATVLLYESVDGYEYYAPSPLTQQIVGATLLVGQPLPATSPCGRNCSYLMSTNAPSYSCSVGAQNPSALNWTSAVIQGGPQFSPPPYFAAKADITPPIREDLFTNWDYQAHYTNYTQGLPVADGGYNITCIAYNSTYNVNYTFAGTTASVVVDDIVPQQLAGQMFPNMSGAFWIPDSDPVVHTAWYNAMASYYAILDSIAAYTIGSMILTADPSTEKVHYTPSTILLGQTPIMQAANTSAQTPSLTWILVEDIPPIFESLLQNITLSILTGAADRSQSMMTTCIYSNNNTHFVYNERRLWLTYGLGLGVALLCDFIGIIALFQNKAFGGATGSNFGDFLAATRNPELNELNLNESGRIRLKYGPVLSEGGRYAFGRPDTLAVGGKESSLLGSM
ncbi:hypothetical protein MSAN_01700200 [Mycena sanguinolenta]|uniref:Uncharacterized protein n=1 Tax=Mycena sanguinolenta TaxID=230812 RepID=A0A8H7CTF5_9AGAR|nr:hypothetical protein MSAN_01700200 [Mycena sanguinolenta]